MSYSRWGGSYWYTFWAVPLDGVIEGRDTAVLEVCGIARFSAKEIRDDRPACIVRVRNVCRDAFNRIANPQSWRCHEPSEADIDELRTIMDEFLVDVDCEYPAAMEE